ASLLRQARRRGGARDLQLHGGGGERLDRFPRRQSADRLVAPSSPRTFPLGLPPQGLARLPPCRRARYPDRRESPRSPRESPRTPPCRAGPPRPRGIPLPLPPPPLMSCGILCNDVHSRLNPVRVAR